MIKKLRLIRQQTMVDCTQQGPMNFKQYSIGLLVKKRI